MTANIPAPETIGRVLRRTDRDPRQAANLRYTSYDVNLRAHAVEIGGVTAPTLFFPKGKDAAAHRASRLGWTDVTDAYFGSIGASSPIGVGAQLSALQHAVSNMKWQDLQRYARERGINVHGLKRPELEADVMEWHTAQVAKAAKE